MEGDKWLMIKTLSNKNFTIRFNSLNITI